MFGEYIIPDWFLNYGITLEILFCIVSFVIGIYAYRIYKLVKKKELRLFSLSFLMIGASYLVKTFYNFLVLDLIIRDQSKFVLTDLLTNLSMHAYLILYILGLLTLVYMTFKVRGIKLYSLLALLTLFSFLSTDRHYGSYLLSTILLFYVVLFYFKNYLKKKDMNKGLILAGFLLILLSKASLVISIEHIYFFILLNILEFLGYALLLISLILIIRKK